jgi:hypothetical protein
MTWNAVVPPLPLFLQNPDVAIHVSLVLSMTLKMKRPALATERVGPTVAVKRRSFGKFDPSASAPAGSATGSFLVWASKPVEFSNSTVSNQEIRLSIAVLVLELQVSMACHFPVVAICR